MKARSGWVKKIRVAFTTAAIVAVVGAGILYWKATAMEDVDAYGRATPQEARAIAHKLDLFSKALDEGKYGYVRLSEEEINAFLAVGPDGTGEKKISKETEPPDGVYQERISMEHNLLTLHCWTRVTVFGKSIRLIWRRTYEMIDDGGSSNLELTSMRVGDLPVPAPWWDEARERLTGDETTAGVQERLSWLDDAPDVRIVRNELSRASELQLYTYRVRKDLTEE